MSYRDKDDKSGDRGNWIVPRPAVDYISRNIPTHNRDKRCWSSKTESYMRKEWQRDRSQKQGKTYGKWNGKWSIMRKMHFLSPTLKHTSSPELKQRTSSFFYCGCVMIIKLLFLQMDSGAFGKGCSSSSLTQYWTNF